MAASGLGLVISKRLSGTDGAEIGAFQPPGQGSTFWFE
jgi:signal transduction histidine kinase